MKRVISMVLAAALLLTLSACGGSNAKEDAGSEKSGAVQVDEGLFNVDVTLAAALFEDQTEEEIQEKAKEAGYSNCKINEDGSVTYTMTKKQYDKKRKELKTSFDELIAGYLEGENKVESFVDIQCNEDYSQIDVYVDADRYTMWDRLCVMSFYIAGAYYQSFAGVAANEIDVVVNFIDNDTKEVIETGSYKAFLSNSENTADSAAEKGNEDEPLDLTDFTSIQKQETVTIPDTCEFFVEYVNITNKVIPPQPDSWYSYYEAEKGKNHIDVCVAYKNLSSSACSADEVAKASLIYGEKYRYNGFSTIEESNRGDFTYTNLTNISPLSTEYLHYIFTVPEAVETNDRNLTVLLIVDGNPYQIVVREGTPGEPDSLDPNAVAKTSGRVTDGEIVAVMNTCEFYVDYCEITDDVRPPHPEDLYSHYKADDGKAYVDFCVAYKNWETESVMADEVVAAKLTYANQYEYAGFSMIEESNRGDFTYSNIAGIAPLTKEYLHYLFEVPVEIENSSESIEITFTIGGNTYTYQVR